MDELNTAVAPQLAWLRGRLRKNYTRGLLAMANGGLFNTNGSRSSLVYEDSRLRPDYTVFGYITEEGMRVLDAIAAGGWRRVTGLSGRRARDDDHHRGRPNAPARRRLRESVQG